MERLPDGSYLVATIPAGTSITQVGSKIIFAHPDYPQHALDMETGEYGPIDLSKPIVTNVITENRAVKLSIG